MSQEKYKIDSVHEFEARYKQVGGLQVGIPRGVRVEDIENEIANEFEDEKTTEDFDKKVNDVTPKE